MLEVAAVIVLLLTIVLAGFIVKWGRLALDLPLSVGALAEAGEEAEAAAVEAERILVSRLCVCVCVCVCARARKSIVFSPRTLLSLDWPCKCCG